MYIYISISVAAVRSHQRIVFGNHFNFENGNADLTHWYHYSIYGVRIVNDGRTTKYV